MKRAGRRAGGAPGAFGDLDQGPGCVLVVRDHLATVRQGVLALLQPPGGRQDGTVHVEGHVVGGLGEEGLVGGAAGAGRRPGGRARRGCRRGGGRGTSGRHGRVRRGGRRRRRRRRRRCSVDHGGRARRRRRHEDDDRRCSGARTSGQHQAGGQREYRSPQAQFDPHSPSDSSSEATGVPRPVPVEICPLAERHRQNHLRSGGGAAKGDLSGWRAAGGRTRAAIEAPDGGPVEYGDGSLRPGLRPAPHAPPPGTRSRGGPPPPGRRGAAALACRRGRDRRPEPAAPYWAFAWAGGFALGRYLREHTEAVTGQAHPRPCRGARALVATWKQRRRATTANIERAAAVELDTDQPPGSGCSTRRPGSGAATWTSSPAVTWRTGLADASSPWRLPHQADAVLVAGTRPPNCCLSTTQEQPGLTNLPSRNNQLLEDLRLRRGQVHSGCRAAGWGHIILQQGLPRGADISSGLKSLRPAADAMDGTATGHGRGPKCQCRAQR